MPNDGAKDQPTSGSMSQGQQIPVIESQPVQKTPTASDRTELLSRARSFLASPQVRLQDSSAKRAFLAEKGLIPTEIDQLLRELPPSVPPRTYPAPPPSNLPSLLVGAARIFTWLTGTSAIVFFVYYRYLLPRLAQTYQARLTLRKHQSALIARFTASVSSLKATQADSYKDLPRRVPVYEGSQYAQYHSIDDLLSHAKSSRKDSVQPGVDIPDIPILRCALEELSHSKADGVATEELFRHLEGKMQWLGCEEGAARQSDLWNQLNSCPLFVSTMPKPGVPDSLPPDHPSQLLWKYAPPPLPPTLPLLVSLENLQAALPRSHKVAAARSGGSLSAPAISTRQRTLQALSDFTGYITTQTYSFSLPSTRGTNGVASGGGPIEDELRREIRVLKGLVLNRRSFLLSGPGTAGSTNGSPRFSEA